MTPFQAEYLDGERAKRHSVSVSLDAGRQALVIEGQAIEVYWPLSDIRRVQDSAGAELSLFLHGGEGLERVMITDEAGKAAILTLAQNLDRSDVTGRTWGRIAVWSTAAAAALGLMIFVIVPAIAGSLAPLISPEREAALGRATLSQIERVFTLGQDREEGESWFCDGTEGQAALAKMTDALLVNETIPYDLRVQVADHEMFNAFALPGGHIILMRGLIERASSPEQVAGVLAHELAHVAFRDPTEQALRAAGTAGLLSLILGDATGGTVIALVGENLINASYSRTAEARADDYALARMKDANLSPESFAQFFDIIVEDYGDTPEGLGWLSTHPASEGRADVARSAVDGGQTYEAVLTPQEWEALKSICD